MCDDHAGPTRRQLFRSAGALAATAALLPPGLRRPPARLPLSSPARLASYDGASAYSMAMHIHSSFSEQDASMDGHLAQAAQNLVDVVWWTDHDGRMNGRRYRKTVHFTSLTAEAGAPGEGNAWLWTVKQHGVLSGAYGGGIVATPCSPNDPVAGGALQVSAQTGSTTGAAAAYGYWANSQPAGWNYHDSLDGQSQSIDVLLAPGWSAGYLEYLIGTSYHPAAPPTAAFPSGRPAGGYSLSCRFIPGTGVPAYAAHGNAGIITVPLNGPGDSSVTLTPASDGSGWVTAAITPCAAIAVIWADLDSRDFAMYALTVSAVSTGDPVSGYFDYLRFDRSASGQVAFSQQADMAGLLASKYPSVTQYQGLEVSSGSTPHLNWFGPGITVPDYTGTRRGYWNWTAGMVPKIHSAGGLVSWNHPYGPGDRPLKTPAQQDALLAQTAAPMLAAGVFGCDLLEVAYNLREGMNLAHHLGLWDVFSRNAVFLTGNGVSDDHFGYDWRTGSHCGGNNFTTSAWAASSGMSDLQAALAAGRAWCGSLAGFAGPGVSLDLLADGSCPMGSVSVSSLPSRQLTITAAGIPSGGSVTVLQGAVDYAGTNGLASNAQATGSIPDTEFAAGGGQVTAPADTTAESYVRTIVLDATGKTVAVSNPVWLLQNTPPNGIPAARQA